MKQIIPHEDFGFYYDYDFSLIELMESIQFDETMQPIKLADAADEPFDGALCFVSGWGDTQDPNISQEILRGVEIPIFNQKKCDRIYGGLITDRMICAGSDKKGKGGAF